MERSTVLSNTTTIDLVEYRLQLSRTVRQSEASQLRGYFGHSFSNEVLLHHHKEDGSLRYAYPRVQFKVIERTAYLIGLAEGCDLVVRLWGEVDHTRIGNEELPVLESGLIRRREPFGESDQVCVYRFGSPWLGLNQENHRQYEATRNRMDRQILLERVLVGNCLSVATSLGHRVHARLWADASGLRPCPTRLKGVSMQGFVGTFRINFQLPNRLGIGKSVSRGFGTVERQE